MKKLQGMKSGFSSLENKKLKNLQTISGGLIIGSSRNAPSGYSTPQGNVVDTDYYTDDTAGDWKYKSRLIIGEVTPTNPY